jgi:hypothetical protein
MGKLIAWNDESLRNKYVNTPLAIVATGPSHDLLKPKDLDGFHILAVNTAITQYFTRQNTWWIVHDLWKIWRCNFWKLIKDYENWNLITRRVYIPGKFGDIVHHGAKGETFTDPFPWRMKQEWVNRATIYWYSEFPNQPGYIEVSQTTVENALGVATFWGFNPIVLIGVDMGYVNKKPYGRNWLWKRCHIKDLKFSKMRKALIDRRKIWAKNVYTTSPYWHGQFTKIDSPQDALSSISLQTSSEVHILPEPHQSQVSQLVVAP